MVMNWLHRFLVPSEQNGYRPNSLEAAASSIMLLLIVGTFAFANLHAILLVSSDWFVGSIIPAALVTLTNEERSDDALPTLVRNSTLDEAAQMKAEDMAKYSYFAHESPSGVTPWHWFKEAGYNYAYAGENLAVHFNDSDEVVRAWMNSPGHRANIMGNSYAEIGIGTAKGVYKGAPTVYVVQLFGTPLSPAVTATVKPVVQNIATLPVDDGIESVSVVLSAQDDSEESIHVEEVEKPQGIRVTENSPIEALYLELAKAEESELLAQAVPAYKQSKKVKALLSDVATTAAPIGSVTVSPRQKPALSVPARMGDLLYKLLSSPNILISTIYLLLTCLVVFMLVMAIVIEFRRQHPVQVAYGVGLMAVMFLMFTLHITLTSGALIV